MFRIFSVTLVLLTMTAWMQAQEVITLGSTSDGGFGYLVLPEANDDVVDVETPLIDLPAPEPLQMQVETEEETEEQVVLTPAQDCPGGVCAVAPAASAAPPPRWLVRQFHVHTTSTVTSSHQVSRGPVRGFFARRPLRSLFGAIRGGGCR